VLLPGIKPFHLSAGEDVCTMTISRILFVALLLAMQSVGCDSGRKPASTFNIPPGKALPEEIKGPLGIEFVLIPAGSFYMGCDATDATCRWSSQPKHKVTITKPFYLSK